MKENSIGYLFKEGASQHFAEQLEGQQINGLGLLDQIKLLQQFYDVVTCEGAGRLFVPLGYEKIFT